MDISELKKLIALCRKSGIASIKVGDTEIQFAEKEAVKLRKQYSKRRPLAEQLHDIREDIIENESELTPEQLLFYSAPDSQEQPS
jgi:hypothetical protein